ncbi:ROK family glucokinase [Bacillus tuaregi]|uniref:ROK family glucokinase n=1 Tax=Bacillus tuaregi TaxID=1816695 RepID=UPI0008F8A86B|nr:ROK family glucokinase [Bacillus tuaregi]
MDDKWFVGVDIGGTTIKLAFITDEGEIAHKWEIPTNTADNGIHIPSEIGRAIDRKISELGETKGKLIGLGVGAPGPVNDENGSIEVAVNLGWSHFPLRELLEQATSLPVIVDNDANVAAIGEMWKGAGEGAQNLLCVTLGTGVGGGVIANGEILHGVNGAAGEIGHIAAVIDDAVRCNCGKLGCLETVASATGVVRLAKTNLQSTDTQSILRGAAHLSAKKIFDEAKAGDELALEVVNKLAFYLGFALANIANVTNPEKIVIGGGVSKAGETLLQPLQQQFMQYAFTRVAEGAELRIAKLGNDAGIIGAAWLAKTKLVLPQL